MRILLTGMKGTLAPKVAAHLRSTGAEILAWDRDVIPPEDVGASEAFLAEHAIGGILHLAMGAEGWAARMAAHAAKRGVPFVFTSTAMVFHHEPDGPHHPSDERTAQDGYGRYKARCEDAVRAANPAAMVVRIGWQIDADARGNNMLAHLDSWQEQGGRVEASRAWRPACSFMEDTARALGDLVRAPAPGVIHLDSNASEGHTFDRVVLALKQHFGRGWRVEVTEAHRHDQRLVGGEGRMPGLSARLAELRG